MNNQMHFKIRTTEALKERKYMDTFIIYAKPEQEKNIYETLYKIYQNNPELFEDAQKGKLPFVSVGREIADGVNSYNSLIASDLKDALFDTIKQYNYPPDQISSFLYSIDKDNIEKYMPSMKEHVKKYFEKDEKYIDKSIIEELGVNKKNNNAIEIETPWYEKNGKNQRTLSLVRPQGKSLALIETSSEIEGLKRYGLQYKDSKGKIEKVIIAYSEGINFDLMINDNEYFEAVNNILLDEKRLNTKQLEAKRYGMLPNILYIGTIGADKEGNLTKMAEKDTKKIYGKIKRKSESDHINENKEEREKD